MKKTLLVLLSIITLSGSLSAQLIVSDVQLEFTPGDNSSISSPFDSVFNVTCEVQLVDSVNIKEVHFIKSTSPDGSNPIITEEYNFLNPTGSNGPAVIRNGLSMSWSAGTTDMQSRYYYIFRTEDFQGNLSDPYIKQ